MSKAIHVRGIQPTVYEKVIWDITDTAVINQLTNDEIRVAWIEKMRGEPDWPIEHNYLNIKVVKLEENYTWISYIEHRFGKYFPRPAFNYNNWSILESYFLTRRDGVINSKIKPQSPMPEFNTPLTYFDTLEEAEAHMTEIHYNEESMYQNSLTRVAEKKTWPETGRRFLMPQVEL